MSPSVELSHRDRAILRAVAAGQGELTRSCEPDLYLEGRCCSDQAAVHRLTHAGLIAAPQPTPRPATDRAAAARAAAARAAAARAVIDLVPARLTPAGHQLARTVAPTGRGTRR